MTWLKIDDVAKQTGLTKRTVRFYEEIGLIDPPQRSEGGIRLYTQADVERLKKISDAKEVLGFSLQELQQFLKISESIERHRQGYRASPDKTGQMSELKQMAEALEEQLRMLKRKIDKMLGFQQEIESLYAKAMQLLENDRAN